MHALLLKLKRSYNVHKLTGCRWRPASVRPDDKFRINGIERMVRGPACLSMLLEIVCDDVYGVNKCSDLGTVIDVGANIGVFCLQVHSRFPDARIIAIEPSATNRDYLIQNVSDFATIFPYAIADADGAARLATGGDGTAYHLSEANPIGQTEEVATITLETLIAKVGGPIHLLKSDCEGGEYAIFRSDALRHVNRIVAELHTCAAGNPAAGLAQLRERGFQIERWRPFPDGLAGIVWATQTALSK
jgi:FkbM family methyltransferase